MHYRIFTINEFSNFIHKYQKLNNDLKERIKYFGWNDLRHMFASDEYINSLRFFVAIEKTKIVAIAKCAIFEYFKDEYTISYLSVDKEYQNKGIAKSLICEIILHYKLNHSDLKLSTSQYSIKGWKYLRPFLLSFENKINFKDNVIGYDMKTKEDYELASISKQLFKEKYNTEYIY